MDQHSTLSSIVSEFRRKNELTLRELGTITGISYSHLSKIERGEIEQPPRDTIETIAKAIGFPIYRLLISAGYIVNLETDIRTMDLRLTEKELKTLMMKYRIFALRELSVKIKESRINLYTLADIIGIDIQRLRDIESLSKNLTLEETVKICSFLGIKFYECFQVVRINYDVKFIGLVEDEDVAMTIYRYIEKCKEDIFHVSNKEIAITTTTNEIINHFRSEKLTGEEVIYLRNCLEMYRRLKLKPSK